MSDRSTGLRSAQSVGVLENVVHSVEFYLGANLFLFANNDPIVNIDSFGLDIWRIRSCKWPGHDWVVGNNPDGTYWDSNFHPDTTSGWGLNCKGKVDFHPNSLFDPTKPADCLAVVGHVITSPVVDAKVKQEAQRRADDPNQPRYDACGNNCRDYSQSLSNFARGANLRQAWLQ